MNSRRAGTVLAAAALLAAGCYRSATPVVGDADLARAPGLADGRYCLAAPGWDGRVAVDADECRELAWAEDARVYREHRDWDGADWSLDHEVARLSDDLYMSQVFEAEDRYPYTLVVFAPGPESFAVIGDAGHDGFGAFAAAYADVATDAADPYAAGRIHSGDPERIRALVELAARSDLSAWLENGEAGDEVAVYVRLDAEETPEDAAQRYAAAIEHFKSRFVRLRR